MITISGKASGPVTITTPNDVFEDIPVTAGDYSLTLSEAQSQALPDGAQFNVTDGARSVQLTLTSSVVAVASGITNIQFENISIDEPRMLFSISDPVDCTVEIDQGSGFELLGTTGVYANHNYPIHAKAAFNFEYDTTYTIRITPNGRSAETVQFTTREEPTATNGTDTMTYAEIRTVAAVSDFQGTLDFQSSGDSEFHERHLAEYLYLNPSVRYWDQDKTGQVISKLPTPTPSANAIQLPAPSGGDDTSAIQAVLDHPDRDLEFVGSGGTYQIGDLKLRRKLTIFNMPWRARAGRIFDVTGSDVRMHGCPGDGNGRSDIYAGWQVKNGADRFHLTDSGLTNVDSKNVNLMSGVYFQGGKDYHIVGNDIGEFTNDDTSGLPDGDSNRKTCRCNAFFYNSGNSHDFGGGYICNNNIGSLQSSGRRDDAEFFTRQSGANNDGLVYVFGNRCVNSGKRLAKLQHGHGGVLFLSNFYHWRDRSGPIDNGTRKQYSICSIQQDSEDVTLAHNRLWLAGDGRWDHLLDIENYAGNGNGSNSNIVFENNDVNVIDDMPANFYGLCLAYRDPVTSQGSGNRFRNNRLRGSGSVNYLYEWDGADPSRWDLTGNQIDIPVEIRTTK